MGVAVASGQKMDYEKVPFLSLFRGYQYQITPCTACFFKKNLRYMWSISFTKSFDDDFVPYVCMPWTKGG